MRPPRVPWCNRDHQAGGPGQQDGRSGAVAGSADARPDATASRVSADTDLRPSPDDAARCPAPNAEQATPGRQRSELTPRGQFWSDLFADPQQQNGFAFVVRVVTAAALKILFGLMAFLLGSAAAIYLVTLHDPVAAKIAIPSGSIAITLAGTVLTIVIRGKRRGGKDDG
jgi:hypothetical protein